MQFRIRKAFAIADIPLRQRGPDGRRRVRPWRVTEQPIIQRIGGAATPCGQAKGGKNVDFVIVPTRDGWAMESEGSTDGAYATKEVALAPVCFYAQILSARSNAVADNPKDVGKSDRIRASMQPHEMQYIAKKFGISGQAASGAIRAAGPMREKVYEYIKQKKRNGDYA